MERLEDLREALLDLEKSRNCERQQRKLAEALLVGFQAIVQAGNADEIFLKLIEILRGLLDFEAAFVLMESGDGILNVVASSDTCFADTVWHPQAMFERVFQGKPVAVYDTGLIDEWRIQSDVLKQKCRSALHFSMQTSKPRVLFVCIHSVKAHFTKHHVDLAQRFSAVAAQALHKIESDTKITELEQAGEQIQHLNLVLRAIRNVNQLIVQEKDRDRLLQGVCKVLSKDRGFFNCWIVLFDEDQRVIAVYESGLGDAFDLMEAQLMKGNFPHCLERTLRIKGLHFIEKPSQECTDCLLSSYYSGRGGFSTRLEHEGKIFGVLVTSLPQEFYNNKKDRALFREVADDIAFALHALEVEKEHKQLYSMLRLMCDNLPELIWSKDLQGRFLFANKACCEDLLNAKDTDEPIGKDVLFFKNREVQSHPENPEYHTFGQRCTISDSAVIDAGKENQVQESGNLKGKFVVLDIRKAPFIDEDGKLIGTVGTARDITNQVRLENERDLLEKQYRHSQRMEAIGQLAGGVAHDFNNLLTIMNGYAEFAVESLREGDPLRADIQEIISAGKKATSLTRQLLGFSRKQLMEPKILDFNDVITGLENMIRRLIGEDIDFSIELGDDLDLVSADPNLIEQVLMNLIVNARDAMPQGGKLVVETANVYLDEEYVSVHADSAIGSHVMLAVSDSGAGMTAEVREHIFEPFYTTKEDGQGTGLGLATVYGIVKQSGGNIWVYSEPDMGTTFKVYLPKIDAQKTEKEALVDQSNLQGTETILVVEDEKGVRELATRLLTSAGYKVFPAANGGEALLLYEMHGQDIDLLLTDVVMPKMSGKDLTDRLMVTCSDLKVIFMSGYTDNAIQHHGVLDRDTNFIAKPFNSLELLKKLRMVLDSN